jgi:hypothetical protein
MGKARGIVCRSNAVHLSQQAGYTKTIANSGAVILVQRFVGALDLNIHLMCLGARMSRAHGCAGAAHMLFLDGVYVDCAGSPARIRWVEARLAANSINSATPLSVA